MKIIITGVNVNNDHLLNHIAGDAGISLQEIQQMVGRFVMHGFGVSVEHDI